MIKVYLLWLHDSVLSVHATRAGALQEAKRQQDRLGGTWNANAQPLGETTRFYREDNHPQSRVARLEVEERDVR